MFCPNCGKENPEGAKFCSSCGKPLPAGSAREAFDRTVNNVNNAAGHAAETAKEAFNSAGQKVDSAVSEVARDLGGGAPAGGPLKTDRSLVAYVLLSIITCGIYGYYFIYTVARDVNIACSDNDTTSGLGMFILLNIVTCGFYGLYWEYKIGNRLSANAKTYGIEMQENGTTILLWRLLGALICFVGSFVGSYILIKNINAICAAYNREHGLQ